MNVERTTIGILEKYLLAVDVYLDTYINDVLFTGKLVKSLLIDANPRLKEIFTKSSSIAPKLIHVSPLYQEVNEKVKCLYSYIVEDRNGQRRIEKTAIRTGAYRFYIGFVECSAPWCLGFNEVYNTLLDITGIHKFSNHSIRAELVSMSVVDVATHARSVVKELLAGSGKIRVVFSSPTLLRDPLRTSKHKSLVPTPINILSTPTYILHYLTGTLRARSVMKTLLILHRLLNEPYSYIKTAEIRHVVYDKGKNPIPALIGYINLYLNKAYYEHYSKTYEVEKLLENVFTTMLALGTGTSRATGFGHTIVKTAKETRRQHPQKLSNQ